MKYLLRLYPLAWRRRYGEELEALLDDGAVGWRSIPNLFAAAMKEQFNMQSLTRLVGWLSAAGLVAGFLASFAVAPRYTSHAAIELTAVNAAAILNAATHEAGSRAALAQLINAPKLDLYEDERREIPLEDVEDGMRRDTRIASMPVDHPNTARLAIDFTYRDPVLAQQTVEATVDVIHNAIDRSFASSKAEDTLAEEKYLYQIARLEEHIAVLETRLGITPPATDNPKRPDSPRPYEFSEIDRPSLPERPVSPNRALYAAAGFGAGIAAALLAALLRRRPYTFAGPIPL